MLCVRNCRPFTWVRRFRDGSVNERVIHRKNIELMTFFEYYTFRTHTHTHTHTFTKFIKADCRVRVLVFGGSLLLCFFFLLLFFHWKLWSNAMHILKLHKSRKCATEKRRRKKNRANPNGTETPETECEYKKKCHFTTRNIENWTECAYVAWKCVYTLWHWVVSHARTIQTAFHHDQRASMRSKYRAGARTRQGV